MKLDHVLYAVSSLEEAGARFERDHGLASYEGGHHPVFGTANRIVPLGESYIELIAVADPLVANENPIGQMVGSIADTGGGWLGWVVGVEDIEAHASRVGTVVIPGQRVRPDGVEVCWQAAGMERLLEDRSYPFFIAWDDPSLHPGRREAAAASTTLEVAVDGEGLARWLNELPSWVTVVPGSNGVRRVLVDGRPID